MKKILITMILVLGLLLAIAGIVLIGQAGASHTSGSGLSRASTSIKFGADFYTTSAQATGLAANAVIDLYSLTSVIAGIFFIFVGMIDICVTLLLTNIKELLQKDIEKLLKKKDQPATEPQTAAEAPTEAESL